MRRLSHKIKLKTKGFELIGTSLLREGIIVFQLNFDMNLIEEDYISIALQNNHRDDFCGGCGRGFLFHKVVAIETSPENLENLIFKIKSYTESLMMHLKSQGSLLKYMSDVNKESIFGSEFKAGNPERDRPNSISDKTLKSNYKDLESTLENLMEKVAIMSNLEVETSLMDGDEDLEHNHGGLISEDGFPNFEDFMKSNYPEIYSRMSESDKKKIKIQSDQFRDSNPEQYLNQLQKSLSSLLSVRNAMESRESKTNPEDLNAFFKSKMGRS